MLKTMGHQSHCTVSGEIAIEMAEAQYEKECQCKYQLVLSDVNMPMMDGFETCQIMRKMIQEKTLGPLNIIACTAGLSEEQLNRC